MTAHTSCTRFSTFIYDAASAQIFAGDDKGLIHRISDALEWRQQSPATSHGVAIHAITCDDKHVYTRDVAGNLVRWRKDSLAPIDFLVTDNMTEEHQREDEATPVPSASQALQIIDGKLLVANARGSLTVIDVVTFTFEREIVPADGAFPESVFKGPDGRVWVTDVVGRVYAGSLQDRHLTIVNKTRLAVVHRLVFESVSRRFWGTCDNSGSVFFLDENGEAKGSLRITNDDVEDIAFSSDGSRAYVGCFDHHVHVIDTRGSPRELGLIGPFKFQVNHLAMMDDKRLLVMLESGELYLVDTEDGRVQASVGGTTAAWSSQISGDLLHVCTEHGRIERFRLQCFGRTLNVVDLPPLPLQSAGRIRRFLLLEHGVVVHAGSLADVICCASDGSVLWRVQTQGIVRDLTTTPDGGAVFAVNEVGEVLAIEPVTGSVLVRRKFNKPLWCAQAVDDRRIAIGERSMSADRSAMEYSLMHVLDTRTLNTVDIHEHQGNHKRIRLLPDGRLLVNGNGSIKVRIVDPQRVQPTEEYVDWIINTPEAACLHGDRVYVVTYGYQLITYDCATRVALDVQFVTEGYPTSLEVFEGPEHAFLVATGRNFISTFLISQEGPKLVMSKYLSAHAAAVANVVDDATQRIRLVHEGENARAMLESCA
jgi:outer membrane protein assembly factor BamB